jgi:DNA mismatch repair protein MutH
VIAPFGFVPEIMSTILKRKRESLASITVGQLAYGLERTLPEERRSAEAWLGRKAGTD